jgi:hypothetical protein
MWMHGTGRVPRRVLLDFAEHDDRERDLLDVRRRSDLRPDRAEAHHMTLHVKIKFKATCPKHHKYDPAKSGEAGIKGGCETCRGLLDLFRSAESLKNHGSKYSKVLDELKTFLGAEGK